MKPFLPVGKIPVDLLRRVLENAPVNDPRVVLGPGIGVDCAVIDMGANYMVLKSDPITFATEDIGWYVVQINANDIATTGATPRWFMVTALLPEGKTTLELIEKISSQVYRACEASNIAVVGGHTEITHSLDKPILIGTMIGEVVRERLITPRDAQPHDRILVTKGVPIEATAILAREFPERLQDYLTPTEISEARDFLYSPGISILPEARLALQTGKVTSMHDPTEGGLAGALWELADASSKTLYVDLSKVPIPPISGKICQIFNLDPFATIASGALLLTVAPDDASKICQTLVSQGIQCAEIGVVSPGPSAVFKQTDSESKLLDRPDRDEIGRVYETRR